MLAAAVLAGLLTLSPLATLASPVQERGVACNVQNTAATTVSIAAPKPTPPPAVDKAVQYSKAPSINDRNFQITCLNAHNAARAKHGAPFLQWDAQLARAAQVWANDCRWEHSGGKVGPYGENMLGIYIPAAQGDIDYPTYNAISKSWYSEELAHYNFNQPGFSHETGHLTQVIWKGTTKVGCAWTYGKTCNTNGQKLFKFVCEYQGQGNVLGGQGGVQWFRENVLAATT